MNRTLSLLLVASFTSVFCGAPTVDADTHVDAPCEIQVRFLRGGEMFGASDVAASARSLTHIVVDAETGRPVELRAVPLEADAVDSRVLAVVASDGRWEPILLSPQPGAVEQQVAVATDSGEVSVSVVRTR